MGSWLWYWDVVFFQAVKIKHYSFLHKHLSDIQPKRVDLTPCKFVDRDEDVPLCSKPSKDLKNLIKSDELEYLIEIYDTLVRGYHHQADRAWTRFKLFFLIDSGIFIVLGFLWSTFIQKESFKIPIYVFIITGILIISGFWASYYWYVAANSYEKWRDLELKYLAKFESYIFRGEQGLFMSIVKLDKECQSDNWIKNMDVTKGAKFNAIVFSLVWAVILFTVLYLIEFHVFQIEWHGNDSMLYKP